MRRVLITVVGPRRRASLAVSAESPIRELMNALVDRCGEAEPLNGGSSAGIWAIVRSDSQALPMDLSLQACGVIDGSILYLRAVPSDPTVKDGAAGAAPTAYFSPRARTRALLPRRLGRGRRLIAVARALLGPPPTAAARQQGMGVESLSSPAALTLSRAESVLTQVGKEWRATDYLTRLERAIVEPRLNRCVTIAVMSPKGGVGKTTITCLLGTLLAHLRRDRIVAVDTNPDYGSLGRSLTPDHTIFVDDLLHLLENPSLAVTALDLNLGRAPHGLMVLPAPTDPARMARLDEHAYTRVIRRLQELVGVVLLDCGTGLQEPAALAALKTSDQVILVSDAEPATASLVAEASRRLAQAPGQLILAVNKMPGAGSRLDVEALVTRVQGTYGLLMIPDEARAASALAAGAFSWPRAPASWNTPVRELAALQVAGWREAGLAT